MSANSSDFLLAVHLYSYWPAVLEAAMASLCSLFIIILSFGFCFKCKLKLVPSVLLSASEFFGGDLNCNLMEPNVLVFSKLCNYFNLINLYIYKI